MKIKYDVDEQRVVIAFREEPLLFFDANHEEVPFACFYSQNGDLAEIRFYESELREELKEQIDPLNGGFTIPENLPQRKYIYQYSTTHPYWGCIDSYNDIRNSDDWFMRTESLAITRRDHKEMTEKEIHEIREDFFEDIRQWLDGTCLGSIYYERTLYFWRREETEPYWPHSEESFKNFIRGYFSDSFLYNCDLLKIQDRTLGFDALVYDSGSDDVTAYVCINGLQGGEDYRKYEIGEHELIQILSHTSNIPNRIIIPLDHLVFSESAVKYIEKHSIRVMSLDDFRKKEFLDDSAFWDDAIRDGGIDPAEYSEIFEAFTIP